MDGKSGNWGVIWEKGPDGKWGEQNMTAEEAVRDLQDNKASRHELEAAQANLEGTAAQLEGVSRAQREHAFVGVNPDGSEITVKDYTDGTIAAAGRQTLSSANAYTDAQREQAARQGREYADTAGKRALSAANHYTDSRYNRLNGKVKKLRARADSGIAGATALASLPFSGLKANSIAGGLAAAKNKVAGAVGYQRNFNNNWSARATLSVSDNYVQGGGGAAFSW